MTMKDLEDSIGQTRYLIGYNVQTSSFVNADLTVLTHKTAVAKHLSKGAVANMGDISLLHGTLTRAVSIPDKLHDNIDIFLVLPRATAELDSFIIQCCSLAYLQTVVTALITQTTEDSEDLDNIIDDIADLDAQTIEDLYVLYGYEIELQYTFDSDGIDDEILEEATKIYAKIEAGQD